MPSSCNRIVCDRTGFPEVALDAECGLRLALLPVTKRQFEMFLAQPTGFGNRWYEEVLQINPRVSWTSYPTRQRERLWLTGLTAIEATTFMSWLGPGHRLPTVDEWQRMARVLAGLPIPEDLPDQLARAELHPAAREIAVRLFHEVHPRSWADFLLLRGGVVEWLDDPNGSAALGAPRPEFHPNAWDPFAGDIVRPLAQQRFKFMGFRPVRTVQAETTAAAHPSKRRNPEVQR